MRKYLVLILALTSFQALAVSRDDAYLDGPVIIIPKAVTGQQAYRLELSLKITDEGYDFSVQAASEIPFTNILNATVFDGLALQIPKIAVNGLVYQITLTLIDPSSLLFRLTGFSLVQPEGETAADLFENKISDAVVKAKCLNCHVLEGIAGGTSLVFSADTDLLSQNILVIERFLNRKPDGKSVILSKVSGDSHGGGLQLAEGGSGYSNLSNLIDLLQGNTATVTSDAAGFFAGVVLEPALATLRRAAIVLAGRLPTTDEVEAVKLSGEAELRSTLRGLMQGDGFREFMVRGVEDKFQLLTTSPVFDGSNFPASSAETWRISRAFGRNSREGYRYIHAQTFGSKRALGELAYYIAKNDRSYKEFVTADYMMMNPAMSEAWGGSIVFDNPLDQTEFRPGKIGGYYRSDQVEVGECNVARHEGCEILGVGTPLNVPLSGALTDKQFLDRFPTTPTNRNRARAKHALIHFLGIDIESSAERPTDKESLKDTNNPTMYNPDCTVCHELLDPVAAAFQNWDAGGLYLKDGENALPRDYINGDLYREGDTWYSDMRKPALFNDAIADNTATLQKLGKLIAEHSNFASGAVRFWWEPIFKTKLLSAPIDKNDKDYQERLIAYNAQEESIETFASKFSVDFDIKNLFVDMIDSAWFSIDKTTSLAFLDAYSMARLGSEKLLTPEELSQKTFSLSGVRWNPRTYVDSPYLNKGTLDTRLGYNHLYGGNSGTKSGVRAREFSPVMLTTAIAHAAAVACPIVINEFSINRSLRRLFEDIEFLVTPRTHSVETIAITSTGNGLYQDFSTTLDVKPGTFKIGVNRLDHINEGGFSAKYLHIKNHSTGEVTEYVAASDDSWTGSKYCYAKDGLYHFGGLCTFEFPYIIRTPGKITVTINAKVGSQNISEFPGRIAISILDTEPSDQSTRPGAVKIKEQIRVLFSRLHGKEYSISSEQVEEHYSLFLAVIDGNRENGLYQPGNRCRLGVGEPFLDHLSNQDGLYQINETHFNKGLDWESERMRSLENLARSDPFYTKYAWSAVVFSMMSDYDYLVE